MQNSDKLDLIIDILKRHEKQFDQIDSRFEQIEKRLDRTDDENRNRFDQLNKRFDRMEEENRDKFKQIDNRLDRIEIDMRWVRDKILELWEHRKEVEVKFSRNWAWQNMIYSGGISITVFIIGFFLFVK